MFIDNFMTFLLKINDLLNKIIPFGPIRAHMGPYGAHMGPCGAHMGPYGYICFHLTTSRLNSASLDTDLAKKRNMDVKSEDSFIQM